MYYAWGYIPVILALRKQRQEDSEFGTNLGYISSRYALGMQQDYILKQKNKRLARQLIGSKHVLCKPNNLSLIPRAHGRKEPLPKVVL